MLTDNKILLIYLIMVIIIIILASLQSVNRVCNVHDMREHTWDTTNSHPECAHSTNAFNQKMRCIRENHNSPESATEQTTATCSDTLCTFTAIHFTIFKRKIKSYSCRQWPKEVTPKIEKLNLDVATATLPTFVCTHTARCTFTFERNTKATCWRALIIMIELCSLKWMHLRDILTCDIVECWIASEMILFGTICGIWWILIWFGNASKIGWKRQRPLLIVRRIIDWLKLSIGSSTCYLRQNYEIRSILSRTKECLKHMLVVYLVCDRNKKAI